MRLPENDERGGIVLMGVAETDPAPCPDGLAAVRLCLMCLPGASQFAGDVACMLRIWLASSKLSISRGSTLEQSVALCVNRMESIKREPEKLAIRPTQHRVFGTLRDLAALSWPNRVTRRGGVLHLLLYCFCV